MFTLEHDKCPLGTPAAWGEKACLHNLFWPDPLNNAKDQMSPEPFWLSSLLSLTDGIELILLGMDGDVEEKMPWSLELCMEPCV